MNDDRFPSKTVPWWRDALERIVWTATQAILAVVGVDVFWNGHVDPVAIPLIITALTALKTVVAKHIGDSSTASIGA